MNYYPSLEDVPHWRVYSNDAKNAALWFQGYCNLAESGLALLAERDKLRLALRQLRKKHSRKAAS